MAALKTIEIIGGGLAGLTLGIGLRQREIPVVIWEAGRYPRHRVCGEFISGRGQETLRRLGLLEHVISCHARMAWTATFFSEQISSREMILPRPALAVSRLHLDERLADEFRRSGGDLRENIRCSAQTMMEGVVRASGRRIHPIANGWRWLGLKVHAQRVCLKSDLELHLTPDGYVGLCQLDGEVNVCGLFRSRTPLPDALGKWRSSFSGTPGSSLARHCAEALFDEASLCSVAGLSFQPTSGSELKECSVGDAFSMIAPVTGNGMSMAFESAAIAIEPLQEYSRGKQSWEEAQQLIARRCSGAFRARLRLGSWLQKALFHPRLSPGLIRLINCFPQAFSAMFMHTR